MMFALSILLLVSVIFGLVVAYGRLVDRYENFRDRYVGVLESRNQAWDQLEQIKRIVSPGKSGDTSDEEEE